jgi:aspartate/methionine/tyrosine aminotransferase
MKVVKTMGRLQSHMTENAVTIAQYTAPAVLTDPVPNETGERMKAEFARRGRYMSERSNGIEGVVCPEPTGTFPCFPDVSAHYDRNIRLKAEAAGTLPRCFWSRPGPLWFPARLLAVRLMCV